jgi:hypothetical protein
MTQTQTDYVNPNNAGLASESHAVGRRIAKMLDSLASINRWVVEGPIEQDCWKFRTELVEKLRASGWRVSLKANDNFQVLPPKDKEF